MARLVPGCDAAAGRTVLCRCGTVTEPSLLQEWTPGELRHSFVSLLADAGVPIEQISRLVGHGGTTVTEMLSALRAQTRGTRDEVM